MKDQSNELGKALKTKVPQKKDTGIRGLIERQLPAYEAALFNDKPLAQRFVRIIHTLLRQTPALAECHPPSLLGATMQAAQLVLDPTLGECWLIPRWNKKLRKKEAHFQIGVRGWEKLFYRATNGNGILEARAVWSCDDFQYSYGANPVLKHIPYANENKVDGEPYMTFVYAVARWNNGMSSFVVLSRKEVDKYRDKSDAYKNAMKNNAPYKSAWCGDYEEMAMNTGIKRLVKRLPKSVELSQAYSNDETVKYIKDANEIEGTYNILDEPPAPENEKEGSYSPEYYQEKVKMYYQRLEEIDAQNWGESQQKETNKKYLGSVDVIRCYVIDDLRSLSNKLQQEISKIDNQEIVQ